MITVAEKQQETVRKMKQSPCQCLVYHPAIDTDIYNEYMDEYWAWRRNNKSNVDKTWILVWLLASQNCPYQNEGKANDTTSNNK